jgi:hypothetical protein
VTKNQESDILIHRVQTVGTGERLILIHPHCNKIFATDKIGGYDKGLYQWPKGLAVSVTVCSTKAGRDVRDQGDVIKRYRLYCKGKSILEN